MALSGTVGATVIDVTSIIEHAVRRCGVLTSVISGEQQRSARDNLYLLLSELVTEGLNLFLVEKVVTPVIAGQPAYVLPVGTEDVLNAVLRSATFNDASVIVVGSASFSPAAPVGVVSVQTTLPTGGSFSLVVESSVDGVVWVQVGAQTKTYTAGEVACVDLDLLLTNAFWRIRELTGTVTFTAATFLTQVTEISMSKLSRDDYVNLTNKTFASNQPLQFWYDKQYAAPRVVLWPVPSVDTLEIVAYVQRRPDDPGAFSDTIMVPQRWLNAIINGVAAIIILELPKELVQPERVPIIQAMAAQSRSKAADTETDGAPIRIMPNIGCYTA